MAEEEKDEQEQGAEEATPAEAPEADAPAEAGEEAPPETGEAPAEAQEAPAPPAEAAAEEVLTPKQARKRARSRHTWEAAPPRGPEERAAERAARRRLAAERRRAYRAKARQKARELRASKPPAEPAPPVERPHGRPKVRQGVVVSDRADKTITVRVDLARRHRRYDKIIRSSSTLHAHDERNDANVGDTVRVVESRPLSRTKRWRLVEVLERAR
jgi:small subunit ribosomal protein S17